VHRGAEYTDLVVAPMTRVREGGKKKKGKGKYAMVCLLRRFGGGGWGGRRGEILYRYYSQCRKRKGRKKKRDPWRLSLNPSPRPGSGDLQWQLKHGGESEPKCFSNSRNGRTVPAVAAAAWSEIAGDKKKKAEIARIQENFAFAADSRLRLVSTGERGKKIIDQFLTDYTNLRTSMDGGSIAKGKEGGKKKP